VLQSGVMKPAIMTAAFLLALNICAMAASPGGVDGDFLQEKCKQAVREADSPNASNPSWSGGLCFGIIEGVIESQLMWQASDKLDKRNHFMSFCIPERVSNDQILRVLVKHLEDHPELLHEGASYLILESLNKAFPCRR
jgi:Rap1a immunity proteins